MRREIDLRRAINAVSDVIQNRPRPIRQFDQIYMKAGDMVLQSELVASWADGADLAFIGDGDAISVCVAYLKARAIVDYGPAKITVFDFDERIVQSVKRFADKERIEGLDACLYNCLDPFPSVGGYSHFYTNPPWGASNAGESVNVFMQRGFEACTSGASGMVVIADDPEVRWTQEVLANAQCYAAAHGFYVSRLMPKLHSYHLDDAPDLRSCNLVLTALPERLATTESEAIRGAERLAHFYGREQAPRVQYVRETKRLDYGMASEHEYLLQLLEGE